MLGAGAVVLDSLHMILALRDLTYRGQTLREGKGSPELSDLQSKFPLFVTVYLKQENDRNNSSKLH